MNAGKWRFRGSDAGVEASLPNGLGGRADPLPEDRKALGSSISNLQTFEIELESLGRYYCVSHLPFFLLSVIRPFLTPHYSHLVQLSLVAGFQFPFVKVAHPISTVHFPGCPLDRSPFLSGSAPMSAT